MSKPVVFDDISKKARDLLKDDYFVGNKLCMKLRHIDGIDITAEAKIDSGKPIVNKISSEFSPCDYLKVKKLSIDTAGSIVGDFDIKNLAKYTTLTMRTLKDYNESGMKKATLGAKYIDKTIALSASYDILSQNFDASGVYAYENLLMGIKARGSVSGSVTADMAASYSHDHMLFTCIGYDMFKRAELGMYYKVDDKNRVAAICNVDSFKEMPSFDLGFTSELSKDAEVAAKMSSTGILSGCYKIDVDKKMTFRSSLSIDTKNLSNGEHKVGVGIDFTF